MMVEELLIRKADHCYIFSTKLELLYIIFFGPFNKISVGLLEWWEDIELVCRRYSGRHLLCFSTDYLV